MNNQSPSFRQQAGAQLKKVTYIRTIRVLRIVMRFKILFRVHINALDLLVSSVLAAHYYLQIRME